MAPEKIVTRGICQVPEGRQLFPTLSVEDNLVVGATGRKDRSSLADDIAYVYELFPILGERRKQEAGTLSGGEQQMLAIGRALTGQPDPAAAGRALHGSGAARGGADLRSSREAQPGRA